MMLPLFCFVTGIITALSITSMFGVFDDTVLEKPVCILIAVYVVLFSIPFLGTVVIDIVEFVRSRFR